MRYDDESQMPDDDDSGEEADFVNFRKKLVVFQDAVGNLDPELYCNSLATLISSTFESFTKGNNQNWRDIEVALYEMNRFSEPLKGVPLPYLCPLKIDKAWENTPHFSTFTNLLAQLVDLGIVLIRPSLTHRSPNIVKSSGATTGPGNHGSLFCRTSTPAIPSISSVGILRWTFRDS